MAVLVQSHRWTPPRFTKMLNVALLLLFLLLQHPSASHSAHNATRARPSAPTTNTKFFFVNDKLDDDEVNSYMSTRLGRNQSTALSGLSSTYPQLRQPSTGHRQSSTLSKSSSLSSRQYSYLLPTPAGKSNSSSALGGSNLSPFLPTSSSSSYLNLVNNNRAISDHNNNNQAAPEGDNNAKVSKLNAFDELDDLSWVQPVYRPNVSTTTPTPTTTTAAAPSTVTDGLVLNYQKAPSPPSVSSSSWPVLTNRTISSTSTHHQQTSNLPTNRSGSNAQTYPTRAANNVTGTFPSHLANVSFALRDEQWVAPIIALSVLNMLVILGFECFVIYRACKTSPSRRHLFLGQMLLLSLFLSSAMGIFFAPRANWLTCTIIRAGVGICYAYVYAVLLVKAVFLLSIHSGVYLPAEYQALLLFFILATQVAIDSQWLIYQTSSTVIDYMDGFGHEVYRCDHSIQQMLTSLIYVMVLIVLIAIMSFRVRGYRENHGEALFIGIVAICTIVLWLVWIAGTITSTPHYRDGFVAFGVVGNATLVFMIMFLPKGRQLAAVGRDGSGHGDDRDQLSTGSSPSIYTPSFLHIKPVSQLIPLAKPLGSVASTGMSNVGTTSGGGFHRSSISNYHLYKQFQGTSTTTVTSPTSLSGPGHPLPAIPNSYSSHAIFNCPPPPPPAPAKLPEEDDDDDGNDPNYSNLSNIYTTSAATGQSMLNSPDSEKLSNNSSSGKGTDSSASSSRGPKGSASSRNSRGGGGGGRAGDKSNPKGGGGGSSPSHKNGFFYLQSPPSLPLTAGQQDRQLPPPPPLPLTRGWRQQALSSASTTKSHHFGTSGPHPSRLYNYMPGVRTANFGQQSQQQHQHQQHSGLNGMINGTSGSSFYPGAPPSSTAAALITTPLGPPPSLISQHPLLSPVSDTEISSYYFSSFDTATRQQQQKQQQQQSNGRESREDSASNHLANFRYFRRPHY